MSDDMDILQRWAAMKLGSSDADVLIGMVAEMTAAARSAALEEAAMVADIEASTDKYATDSQAHRIAAAIRELKDTS